MSEDGMVDIGALPNGGHLYRKPNDAGGYTYYTDECSCMTVVWDTSLTSEGTILSAMACEANRAYLTHMIDEGWRPKGTSVDEERMAVTGELFIPPDIQARLDELAETENG